MATVITGNSIISGSINGSLGGNADNRIINGDFSVAQRGTSFTAATALTNADTNFTLDRWKLLSDGSDIVDVTQSSTAPDNQLTSIALDVEDTNKKFGIAQAIEQKDCIDLIGNEVTLSFKAKASAVDKLDNVKAAIIAWSSTANAPTADMISAWNAEGTDPTPASNFTYENTPANLNITTSWATYSITATVDTSSTTNIIVFIWSDVTDTTAGQFLYLTDVQLEKGAVASDFNRPKFDDALRHCKRYYQTIDNKINQSGLRYFGLTGDSDGSSGSLGLQLFVPMVKQPATARSTGYELKDGGNSSRSVTAINTFAGDNNQYDRVRFMANSAAAGAGYLRFPDNSDFIEFEGEIEA